MRIEKDYEDLLRLFNRYKVRYCVVGAFAVALYAVPRYTKDMDILVEPSGENSRKIIKALNIFGFKSVDLKEEDFNCAGHIIQLGYEPVRVDILTSIAGVGFEEAWENKKKIRYGHISVFFIGREELIKSKKASGREQDKADLKLIERLNK